MAKSFRREVVAVEIGAGVAIDLKIEHDEANARLGRGLAELEGKHQNTQNYATEQ
jgi:prefoldin subunit 5